MKTFFKYSAPTIVGFHDSDGTYGVRITPRVNNYIGFNLCSSFRQVKNEEILRDIQSQIGGNLRPGGFLDIFYATEEGERWLKILQKHPPMVPGKRKDYLISKKIFEFAKSDPRFRYNFKAPYINRSFPELENGGIFAGNNERTFDANAKDKIGSIASAFLCYQMTHESLYGETGGRELSLSEWITHLAPTFWELYFGIKLGKHFLKEIDRKVNELRNRLLNGKKLKKSYVIGHFIGDGCMGFSVGRKKNDPFVGFGPNFYMDEHAASWEITVAFANTLGVEIPNQPKEDASGSRLKVTQWELCANKIVPYFSSCYLPTFRQNQYNIFAKVCKMGNNHQQFTIPGYIEMANLIWNMTENSRVVSLEEALADSIPELKRRQSNSKTTTGCRSRLHSFLRNKYLAKNRLRKEYKQKYNYLRDRLTFLFPDKI